MKPQRPKSDVTIDLREMHTRKGRRYAKVRTGKQARAWSRTVIRNAPLDA